MGEAQDTAGAYPILDGQKLQAIKDLADPDDADGFFSQLLQIFFQRAPELIEEIAEAVASGDAVKLEHSSHALKGTSGNLGAMRMMHLADQLEMRGRRKELAEAQAFSTELSRIYPATKAALEASLFP